MEADNRRLIIHPNPYWGEKADHYVVQRHDADGAFEQLATRIEGGSLHEICCIPFYSYNLALGDIVAVNDDNEVDKVVSASGRWVFRAWFEEGVSEVAEFESKVALHGGGCEWYSEKLVAIDAANEKMAQAISSYLQLLEDSEILVYETGKQ